MMRQNPRLRLGPISSGCNPVSRESMVTALENGVSKSVDWAPSRRAAAQSAGAGPPSSGKAVLSNSTRYDVDAGDETHAHDERYAGATRTVGRAESNAPSGARAPRAFRESTRMPAAPKRANSECEAVSEPRASCPRRARGDARRVSTAASAAIEYDRRDRHSDVSGSAGKVRFTRATAVTSTTG